MYIARRGRCDRRASPLLLRRGGQRARRVVATPLPVGVPAVERPSVTHVRAFVGFWSDFIVGGDWRLAAVTVLRCASRRSRRSVHPLRGRWH